MKILIKQTRRDNKTPITAIFDNGRRFNKLIPNKDYKSVQDLINKYPESTIKYI